MLVDHLNEAQKNAYILTDIGINVIIKNNQAASGDDMPAAPHLYLIILNPCRPGLRKKDI